MNIVTATGHRPKSLPTGYDLEPLIFIAKTWLEHHRPDGVNSGMALGWDQAVAYAALDLGIPVHAYIPFAGQADQWPPAAAGRYEQILNRCTTRRIVSPGPYEPWKMQARNEAMVDNCELVLALWNGGKGGTGNCVTYAEKKGVPVTNLWDAYDLDL